MVKYQRGKQAKDEAALQDPLIQTCLKPTCPSDVSISWVNKILPYKMSLLLKQVWVAFLCAEWSQLRNLAHYGHIILYGHRVAGTMLMNRCMVSWRDGQTSKHAIFLNLSPLPKIASFSLPSKLFPLQGVSPNSLSFMNIHWSLITWGLNYQMSLEWGIKNNTILPTAFSAFWKLDRETLNKKWFWNSWSLPHNLAVDWIKGVGGLGLWG